MKNARAGTLYQRLLGEDFDKLPKVLRRFHAAPDGASAAGIVSVQRGTSALARSVAEALRLPRAGENVPLSLRVVPENSGERWIRRFGNTLLETRQWQDGNFLIEQAGPLRFAFHVAADESGLHFLSQRATCGLAMPQRFSLHIEAHAIGTENGWSIEVEIATPQLGTLAHYTGEVTPTS